MAATTDAKIRRDARGAAADQCGELNRDGWIGTTKINNNFDIVDAVGERDGKGMTATLFAKGGDEYIRVSTSVPTAVAERSVQFWQDRRSSPSKWANRTTARYQFWERPT